MGESGACSLIWPWELAWVSCNVYWRVCKMLRRLSGNWRILSNPPFLLIKGSQIAQSQTYFSSPPFPFSITATAVDSFEYALSAGLVWWLERIVPRKQGVRKGAREIGLGISFVWRALSPPKCNWLEWWIERAHGRSCVGVRNVQGQLPSRLFISVSSLRWCRLNCPELLFSSPH